jgi:hypothetical protein
MIKLSSSWVEVVEKEHLENFKSAFAPELPDAQGELIAMITSRRLEKCSPGA